MEDAEAGVEHAPGDLREPEDQGTQQRCDRASEQHVVDVTRQRIGIGELQVEGHGASMTPLKPPITSSTKKLMVQSMGSRSCTRPLAIVAIQQKMMPDGMAMLIEDAAKKLLPSRGSPVAYMW